MRDKSFSNGNKPPSSGASAYNGLGEIVHGWFCACHWCLNGVRA